MRIGIMLRAIDEKGGIGVYSRYISKELLELDRKNHYVLLYRNAANLGRFASYDNVTERHVKAPNKALWDQVAIPVACWQQKVDVLFHPKFTVPLLAPCKTAMVLHGAGWFMPDFRHFWNDLDLKYLRLMMPLYCRRASAILAVSQITADIFNRTFSIREGKIRTVYFAPGKQFRRVDEMAQLQSVRDKYNLPDQFILHLTGYDRGPRKNIEGVLNAYKIHHGKTPHKLVIGGKDCYRFREDYGIPDDDYGKDIVFTGWIAQEDMPAIYTLADLFLYPSWVEAFPIPITEALSCGTPIVTTSANGLKEIAGDAAYLIDPDNPEEIAEAIHCILADAEVQQTLSEKGLERAKLFNWRKCAEETLGILEGLMNGSA